MRLSTEYVGRLVTGTEFTCAKRHVRGCEGVISEVYSYL